ncbi:GerMN domain-containing protein [Intestinimonas sp. HCP28S3_D6]|uniref:GerMN domain-containing protein n=1 Tax=Intestinimonas sp. HCP28S3_D6 TaxID=3438942 RepID=UPI003F894651
MRKRILSLLCALLLLLTGCVRGGEVESGAYEVYFAAPLPDSGTDSPVQGPAVQWETRRLPQDADVLSALVECLLSGPVSDGLRSPFPDGVYQVSAPTLTDGVCEVDLSERYGGLSGVDLTIADYCIALTLCQVKGVEAVSILVEGEPISYRDHQLLRESDAVLSSAEDEPVYLSADLCFLREEGGLAVEHRELLVPSGSSPESVLLQALLAGPETEGLSAPLSGEARVIDLWVNDSGICYLNFDAAFLSDQPASASQARLTLYAIVNTLCQLPNVDAVAFLVEGESIPDYGGVAADVPLEPNPDLVVS